MRGSVAPQSPAHQHDEDVRQESYLRIVTATALIGGSSIINVLFAVIRNKAVAIVLGPEGIGLMGLYGSILDLAQNLAGLGIQSSGIRQVAEAVATKDTSRIASVCFILNRLSLALGLIGALLLVTFASPVASLTFGDQTHAAGVALLSVAVLCRIVSAGQIATIQGFRRVNDLALVGVFAGLWSTVVCVPAIYWFGKPAVVPTIVGMAFVSLLVSWWYSRRVRAAGKPRPAGNLGRETTALLKLGLAFMASAFLTFGAAYAIRLIVLKFQGLEAAGLYQAAWAIGGLYAGFILQAMGADFYPRLTAIHTDHDACNRLVNEQAQVSILLAGPGLLATLTVAPLLVTMLYSPEFHAASELLRWICMGMMLRIVAWPIGYIVLAKGAQLVFVATEIAATIVHVGLAWLFVGWLGLAGAGMAFFGLYIWHSILIYWIARRMTGFRWSHANIAAISLFLSASAFAFAAFLLLPPWQAAVCGTLLTALGSLYSLHRLLRLLPRERLPFGHRLPQWL